MNNIGAAAAETAAQGVIAEPGTSDAGMPSFAQAFRVWLKIGLLSFGGTGRADRHAAPGGRG